jgi:hypothetical protein
MEQHAFDRRPAPCAEFPNDNQDLHHGATWICIELGGEPVCELPRHRLLAPASDEEARDLEAGSAPSRGPVADPPREIVSMLTTFEAPEGPRDEIVSLLTTCVPAHEAEAPGAAGAIDASGDRLDSSRVGDDPNADLLSNDLDADLFGDDSGGIEIVDELSFDDAPDDLDSESDTAEPMTAPAPADPFAQLVSALRDVAQSLGADDEAVAYVDALYGQTRLEGVAPCERAVEALVTGGVIARTARGIGRSSGFTAKVLAWQGILRGESEDFSLPDGGALEPLDEWAADVLARLLGPPARADAIRRELRRRGIAAFGLVASAA